MELLSIEIYENETNKLVATCSMMEDFTFPIMMNYAWLLAKYKNFLPQDARREDYKFIIR